MKLSKTMKIVLIILIAAISIAVISISCVEIRKQQALRARYMQFEACSEECNRLVDFLQTIYPEGKRPSYLIVADGDKLFLPGSGSVRLPDPVSEDIKAISEKGFVAENADWCMITFSGSAIQFEIRSGAYALVYSPDGAPTYLHEATEGFPIHVEHIEGDWYHVIRTE